MFKISESQKASQFIDIVPLKTVAESSHKPSNDFYNILNQEFNKPSSSFEATSNQVQPRQQQAPAEQVKPGRFEESTTQKAGIDYEEKSNPVETLEAANYQNELQNSDKNGKTVSSATDEAQIVEKVIEEIKESDISENKKSKLIDLIKKQESPEDTGSLLVELLGMISTQDLKPETTGKTSKEAATIQIESDQDNNKLKNLIDLLMKKNKVEFGNELEAEDSKQITKVLSEWLNANKGKTKKARPLASIITESGSKPKERATEVKVQIENGSQHNEETLLNRNLNLNKSVNPQGVEKINGLKADNAFTNVFQNTLTDSLSTAKGTQVSLPPQVREQLQQQFESLLNRTKIMIRNQENAHLSTQLFPKELGKISVKLALVKGQLHGHFLVDNEAVQKELMQKVESLLQDLKDQGFNIADFSVGVDSNNRESLSDFEDRVQRSKAGKAGIESAKFEEMAEIAYQEGQYA